MKWKKYLLFLILQQVESRRDILLKKLQCSNVKKILGEIKGTDFRNFEIAEII